MTDFRPEAISGPTLPAAATRELLEPGRVVGRFRIRKLAGMGGMGEVYQAWDPLLERYVALKAVRPSLDAPEENLERFRREALALAQLSHPHVCQVHDLVTSELGTFIAMEWLEGETLDQPSQKLERRTHLLLIQEVAEGLSAAHAKGIVHRDLKPSNVMVSADRHAKILDFGLARHLNESMPDLHLTVKPPTAEGITGIIQAVGKTTSGSSRFSDPLTQQGSFMGSPRYASPEQIEGNPVGAPSDVFALGIMLWELLAGEHPFPGEGRERFKAVLANRRKPLKVRHLSRSCAALLDGMLAPKPEERLTAAQVAHELKRILRPLGRMGVAALTAMATLVLGTTGYVLLGRGVVADLVKERPAGIAVLPVVNRTGDASMQAELRWVLPDLVGSGLRTSPRLRVVPMEAVSDLKLSTDQEITAEDARKIHRKLGTELCLASELKKTPAGGWLLSYRLLDRQGRTRFEGRDSQETSDRFSLQTLSRKTSLDLLKAVDPFGHRPTQEITIPAAAYQAYAKGKELMDRGDFKEARGHLKKAAESAPFFSGAVVQYGICLQKLGDPTCDLAIQWGRWAARAMGNRRSEIQAVTQLGLLRMEQGQWAESHAAFDEALALARAQGDEDFQSVLFNNLGFLALEQKRPQEAEQFLGQALIIERRLGKKAEEMLTLNNLAVAAKDRGDFRIAEENYLRVLSSARETEDRWAESLALNNLGDVAIGNGAFTKAEGFFRESLRIKRAIGHRSGTVIPLTNLGILGRVQGDWATGRAFLGEALALCQELHKRPMEALVRFQLGCLELGAGQKSAALNHFQSAADLHLQLKDNSGLAQDLAGQAEAILGRRPAKPERVAQLLKQARENEAENPFVFRAEALEMAARGHREEARRRMEQALTLARKVAPEDVPSLQQRLRDL